MSKEPVSFKEIYELVDHRTQEIVDKFDKLDNRVSAIENWKSELNGRIAVLIGVVVFLVSLVSDALRKKFGI